MVVIVSHYLIGINNYSEDSKLTPEESDAFNKLVEFYSTRNWQASGNNRVKNEEKKMSLNNLNFKTSMDAFLVCGKELHSNINFLFKILCTLPVSTITPEHSFSSLKRIKTYLRNSMSEVPMYSGFNC